MEKANLFKEYSRWKKNRMMLAHELVRFEGISDDEVIESMCFSRPEGERIQKSGITDTTGKTAIYYRKVADTLMMTGMISYSGNIRRYGKRSPF